MVRRQEKEAGWAFIFLGVNIDAVQVAGGLGIRVGNAVEFACDDEGVRENFSTLGTMTMAFSKTGVVVPSWSKKISEHLAKRRSGKN